MRRLDEFYSNKVLAYNLENGCRIPLLVFECIWLICEQYLYVNTWCFELVFICYFFPIFKQIILHANNNWSSGFLSDYLTSWIWIFIPIYMMQEWLATVSIKLKNCTRSVCLACYWFFSTIHRYLFPINRNIYIS